MSSGPAHLRCDPWCLRGRTRTSREEGSGDDIQNRPCEVSGELSIFRVVSQTRNTYLKLSSRGGEIALRTLCRPVAAASRDQSRVLHDSRPQTRRVADRPSSQSSFLFEITGLVSARVWRLSRRRNCSRHMSSSLTMVVTYQRLPRSSARAGLFGFALSDRAIWACRPHVTPGFTPARLRSFCSSTLMCCLNLL